MLEHANAVLNEGRIAIEDNATPLIIFPWNTVEPVLMPETKFSKFEAL